MFLPSRPPGDELAEANPLGALHRNRLRQRPVRAVPARTARVRRAGRGAAAGSDGSCAATGTGSLSARTSGLLLGTSQPSRSGRPAEGRRADRVVRHDGLPQAARRHDQLEDHGVVVTDPTVSRLIGGRPTALTEFATLRQAGVITNWDGKQRSAEASIRAARKASIRGPRQTSGRGVDALANSKDSSA